MAATFDAAASLAQQTGSSGPFAFDHTVGGGANLLLVWLGLLDAGAHNATAVTYNSVAMTRYTAACRTDGGGLAALDLWYLVDPDTGTNEISITVAEAISRFYAISVSYSGVDTADPIEGEATKDITASPSSLSLNDSTADSLIVNAILERDCTALSADVGQSDVTTVLGTDDMGVGHEVGGEATETVTWTYTSGSANGVQSIISIKAGAGGAVVVVRNNLMLLGVS